ncbi:hypothetical protein PVAP13_3NG204942 [Panicum virgatum]|uniref:Uncharacterized protein n=1 Tax=Panicum virgatum TaxID=38727 RepID=A0A8T0UHD8_PANVG|nr:hypothetical protein PVAP13_3NG204942 [Panicum virgatum]
MLLVELKLQHDLELKQCNERRIECGYETPMMNSVPTIPHCSMARIACLMF